MMFIVDFVPIVLEGEIIFIKNVFFLFYSLIMSMYETLLLPWLLECINLPSTWLEDKNMLFKVKLELLHMMLWMEIRETINYYMPVKVYFKQHNISTSN